MNLHILKIATIDNVKVIEVEEVETLDYIHSMFKESNVKVSSNAEFGIYEFKEVM